MAGRLRPRRRGLVALSAAAGLLVVGWLATTPWLVDHWPRVLAVVLFLFVFVVPRWFVPARSAASLAGVEDPAARGRLEDDRLKLQNDVRIGLLQAVAGVAVIAAVVVTWQQLETDRRQLRQQLEVAGQEQAGERFARALDQLGSEQLDVRLGGIYGLERIAARAPGAAAAAAGGAYRPPGSGDPPSGFWGSQDRAQVFEILSAYVRTTSHRPPIGPGGADATLQTSQPDVNAAVTVLARRTVLEGDPPLDLSGSLLPSARLGWARLARADLRGADVRGTSLQHADLAGAHLEQSLLCGTQFQGADLGGAHLAGARASADTRWPTGFDWRAAGARLVEAC
ncbi:MAG TPA: pentapeptide repeat-containing protein [Actinomycetota bacterium]|nr:pentapeptide repeat-containing protein [Actinomycetota bacterium]